MPETLSKLQPDRDLQVYFEQPSAVAAMHGATASGFTVSGTWRQQFDWAVVEWNRDNVFEHPLFRNLPDGDLSGLTLEYEETRENAIPMDSSLFPTVDWPHLRVWATPAGGTETIYKVRLRDYATAIEGSYGAASAEFELTGTPAADDFIELEWEGEHYNYTLTGSDTLATAAAALAGAINTFSTTMVAAVAGAVITLSNADATLGVNANRIGVYGAATGALAWTPDARTMAGGTSPTKWGVSLEFGSLVDIDDVAVPAGNVRKLRWTWSADFQVGAYARTEFEVVVSNWSVTGTNRGYRVAGPGSRRIEDDDRAVAYSGAWTAGLGNFSGGSIRSTTENGASIECTYTAQAAHELYLGTRRAANGAAIEVTVDGGTAVSHDLLIAGEDVLLRIPLGALGAGEHTVAVTHDGAAGSFFYFDFLEIALPSTDLPVVAADSITTLATDWDTDHSLALPAERTAWMMNSLGFRGRANHYVGALVFYELYRKGHVYASGTVTFAGTPVFGQTTTVTVGIGTATTAIDHVNLFADTAESIARAFALRINNGYTAIRASAAGAVLTIHARQMGAAGNAITLAASPASGGFTATASASALSGGVDGEADFAGAAGVPSTSLGGWRTDLEATPRINRACRDWSRAYYVALAGYGIEVAAAFSTELKHGDFSVAAGIAQRYPSGNPVLLTTPALQTNFSPVSLEYWKDVHRDMAEVMSEAGVTPYLQFGELQWWYFAYDGSGLPFYDAYTTAAFEAQYSRPMQVFTANTDDPAGFPEESEFLPGLIGDFSDAVMAYVRATYAAAKFEVLYPPDVNDFACTRVMNLPAAWGPAGLDNFKTENFTFTYARDLNKCRVSVELPRVLGFGTGQRSHLVGLSDYTAPWLKEVRLARAEGVESVVLFALDQFCLIGYPAPLAASERTSGLIG